MRIFPKKSLGQNFLIDINIIKKIINVGDINKEDDILEIGPGTGNLTREIIKRKPRKVLLVEKDKLLCDNLKKRFNGTVSILNADVLKINEQKLSNEKLVVFGNLHYNIYTLSTIYTTYHINYIPDTIHYILDTRCYTTLYIRYTIYTIYTHYILYTIY